MDPIIPVSSIQSKLINKRIICLDMNSYFASVEQQDNPHLRGKPIIVSGEGKRTIVVAASKEAKLYGIKTAMKIHEAEKLCPQVIRVYGNGDKYASIQQSILEIIERYFYAIEIASIDEVFIDAQGIQNWERLREIALAIKTELKDTLGECLTCSIGIATSKVMAKLASNMQKPDGLTILTPEEIEKRVGKIEVEEISGIGRQIGKRLRSLGITYMGDLRSFPYALLKKEFGPHAAQFLYYASYGLGLGEVVPNRGDPKSFSHEITLPYDIASLTECYKVIFFLTQKVAHRMRSKKMEGKTIGMYIRYKDFNSTYKQHHIGHYTNEAYELFGYMKKLFLELHNSAYEIRQLGVHVSNLAPSSSLSLPLFGDKQEKLSRVVYEINKKFGGFSIGPVSVYGSESLNRKIHGFYKPFDE